ncbi:hypothetical protein [Haloplanus vescus]
MPKKRILVTGDAGFIGPNLTNNLAPGNDVIALDDECRGVSGNIIAQSANDIYVYDMIADISKATSKVDWVRKMGIGDGIKRVCGQDT